MMLKLLLSLMLTSSHALDDLQQNRLNDLVANMIEDQNCHIEISAKTGAENPLAYKLMKIMPVTLKSLTSSVNYNVKTCILHVINISSEEDAQQIS